MKRCDECGQPSVLRIRIPGDRKARCPACRGWMNGDVFNQSTLQFDSTEVVEPAPWWRLLWWWVRSWRLPGIR